MTRTRPRIGLIHATQVAIEPVVAAFAAEWPQAEISNLLDDSLAGDLARDGRITEGMTARFCDLAAYVRRSGADGILFTCSAFGSAIDVVKKELAPVPVLKPTEAMFEEALATSGRIGMVATFRPSVPSMEEEFSAMAGHRGTSRQLETICVPQAMAALKAGDSGRHNDLVADAAGRLGECALVMLAHFSTAQAKERVSQVFAGTVVTSPNCAVTRMKASIGG